MDLKQTVLQIKILHGALFFGVLLFGGISFLLHNFLNGFESLAMLPSEAFYLIILLAAVLLWLSRFFYKSRITGIEENSSLDKRVTNFRSAVILRAALIEAASLIVIAGYLLSGTIYYLLFAFVPLYFFAITFPRNDKIIEMLRLSYSEARRLKE